MLLDLRWIEDHWLDALQTLGIVAGLWFTSLSAFRDHRSRKLQNLLSINSNHRQIWLQAFSHPHLFRILKPKVNLRRNPVSEEEALFVNLVILHLTTVLEAMNDGLMRKPQGHDADLKEFFSLPIPRHVWRKTAKFRSEATLRHVEHLTASSQKRPRRRKRPCLLTVLFPTLRSA
jgi:hypothetical protein